MRKLFTNIYCQSVSFPAVKNANAFLENGVKIRQFSDMCALCMYYVYYVCINMCVHRCINICMYVYKYLGVYKFERTFSMIDLYL